MKTKPFFNGGISSHGFRRLVYRRSARINQSSQISEMSVAWLSSGSCNGTFDNDPGVDVLPERHQKFARKRDDRGVLLTTTILRHARLEPCGERGSGLMTYPQPGELNKRRAQSGIARLGYTLFLADLATLPRRRRKP